MSCLKIKSLFRQKNFSLEKLVFLFGLFIQSMPRQSMYEKNPLTYTSVISSGVYDKLQVLTMSITYVHVHLSSVQESNTI